MPAVVVFPDPFTPASKITCGLDLNLSKIFDSQGIKIFSISEAKVSDISNFVISFFSFNSNFCSFIRLVILDATSTPRSANMS